MIREAIDTLVKKENLTRSKMIAVMEEIMNGKATPSQIASFLTALRCKGETVDEITGAAEVMRMKAESIKISAKNILVDTCGTGGDEMNTFNISTVAAFVAAGAGIRIAKHGNRSVSSKCGSADLMEALGVNINMTPLNVSKCIEKIGIGFLFAPIFHKAMKHASLTRKEIGIRTIFNILGPLTNPASARAQVIGVYDSSLTESLAHVLKNLGTKEAMIINGHPGMDEISITGPTRVSHLKDGRVKNYTIDPGEFGYSLRQRERLGGGDVDRNREIAVSILEGKKGFEREIVEINAAAAVLVGGGAQSLREGIMAARNSIDQGRAKKKLDDLVVFSNSVA
ncbi:MAG: anthranilate phosphoribosyltransferase [Thermodesulfobacteriota bacterium]|nr:anthranilate phosphoribosyltransferase [Thermodesulfobacteriota bacterium]